VHIYGQAAARLPNTTCLRVAELDAELVLSRLERAGVLASSGAACSAGGTQPSHVLLAMGESAARAKAAVRFRWAPTPPPTRSITLHRHGAQPGAPAARTWPKPPEAPSTIHRESPHESHDPQDLHRPAFRLCAQEGPGRVHRLARACRTVGRHRDAQQWLGAGLPEMATDTSLPITVEARRLSGD
jgi:hypothetical protein